VEERLAPTLSRRRVVFVVTGGALGGAERNVLEVARHLSRSDNAVVDFCALDAREGRAKSEALEAGFGWTHVGTRWHDGKLSTAAALSRFAWGLRRLRPDVVVATTNLPNVVSGLTWRRSGAKLFVWNQADVLGSKRIRSSSFGRALHGAPLVIVPAFHVRDWLVERYGVDSRRIHVIRSKVGLPAPREDRRAWRRRLGIGDDGVAACMLAHLHVGKDHETLLRAWRVVVDRLGSDGKPAVVVLAGRPAGSEASLTELVGKLDLRDSVRVVGEVDDVSGLLAACDLAVFSSRSEGLGRGATEPMYAGLPVAGTDIPGIREAVGDAGAAFLAPPGDAAALADRIVRLAADPELRAQVGRANAALVRERQSGPSTNDVYADLIRRSLRG
jgi:glycosyltransferase involved in cell wall biosynthesis